MERRRRRRNEENEKLKAKFSNICSSLTTASAMSVFFLLEINVCFPKRHETIYFFPSSLSMEAL